MKIVDIHEAKAQFSQLVEAASSGEEIIIAKAGVPAVKLVPVRTAKPTKRLGVLKGKIQVADDFDAPLPDDLLDAFEGGK